MEHDKVRELLMEIREETKFTRKFAMPSAMMDDLLKGLAAKLAEDFCEGLEFEPLDPTPEDIASAKAATAIMPATYAIEFERVLRESGLGELLEAGQAMEDEHRAEYYHPKYYSEWDTQMARVRAAVAGAEKGTGAKK